MGAAAAVIEPIETIPLFPEPPRVEIPGPPRDTRGADARRTSRQLATLAGGNHPVIGYRLHEDAPDPVKPSSTKRRPFTCGTCIHRLHQEHHGRAYDKCELTVITNGAATDLRQWWPACVCYNPEPEENEA